MVLYALVSIIALWRYSFYKNTSLRYFLFFILLQLFVEYIGDYISENFGINAWWYICYYFLNFSYLFILFKTNITSASFRKYVGWCLYLFIAFFMMFIIVFGFDKYSNAFIFISGATLLIISVVFYYVDLLKSTAVINIKSNLLFWISVGVLLFYVGYLPIKILFIVSSELQEFQVFRLIHRILIIIMNLCFITGFLLVTPKLPPSR